eukprot:scaffold500308_cov47-Attheya_sp.AAC.1
MDPSYTYPHHVSHPHCKLPTASGSTLSTPLHPQRSPQREPGPYDATEFPIPVLVVPLPVLLAEAVPTAHPNRPC